MILDSTTTLTGCKQNVHHALPKGHHHALPPYHWHAYQCCLAGLPHSVRLDPERASAARWTHGPQTRLQPMPPLRHPRRCPPTATHWTQTPSLWHCPRSGLHHHSTISPHQRHSHACIPHTSAVHPCEQCTLQTQSVRKTTNTVKESLRSLHPAGPQHLLAHVVPTTHAAAVKTLWTTHS